MLIRKLRLQRCWSQEHLAALCGVSTRTIQRIERGQVPSLETQKALASVFDIDVNRLRFKTETQNSQSNDREQTMQALVKDSSNETDPLTLNAEESQALNYVKGIKEFYQHLFFYLFFGAVIIFNKGVADPQTWWIMGGWTLGIVIHGLVAFEKINIFSARWEKKQIEKRLGRKL